jgi:hypothetical protein
MPALPPAAALVPTAVDRLILPEPAIAANPIAGRRSPELDKGGVPQRGACGSRELLGIATDAYGWTTAMHFADRFQLADL